MSLPTDAELQDAIKKICSPEQLQIVGVKKIVTSLKASNPTWNSIDGINSKRIRALLPQREPLQGSGNSEVESASASTNKVPKENGSGDVESSGGKAGEAPRNKGTVGERYSDIINSFNDKILHLRSFSQTSRASSKNCQLLSVLYFRMTLERATKLGDLLQSPELDNKIAELPDGLHKTILVGYKLFFAEWDTFLGPDPREPMAPVGNFVDRLEPLQFPTLFPHGTDYYQGPTKHPVSFEKYVLEQLESRHFQRHALWLQWTLTLLKDKEVATFVNMCMVSIHDRKARHLGEGCVEVLPLEEDFVLMKLNNKGTKLVEA